jgi:GTP-binding protein
MLFSRVTFLVGSVSSQSFPTQVLPEIAFIGRSNVGKSTLLNAVWGRKKMAHTSKSPGKTREINFFQVDDQGIFVDMPGYGYARVSSKTKDMWDKVIPHYFETRNELVHTYLLMDSRHAPKESDLEILTWLLKAGCALSVVLTKLDKLTPNQQAEQIATFEQILNLSVPRSQQLGKNWRLSVIPFSAKRPDYVEALRRHIEKHLQHETAKKHSS